MKKTVSGWLIFSLMGIFFLSGCITDATGKRKINTQALSTGIGATVGGVLGAAVDGRNRWRGGAIGAVGGALVGFTVGELQKKAVLEAANSGKKVTYQDEKGNTVEAIPEEGAITNCKKVTRRTTINGKREEVVDEVCEGQLTTRTY